MTMATGTGSSSPPLTELDEGDFQDVDFVSREEFTSLGSAVTGLQSNVQDIAKQISSLTELLTKGSQLPSPSMSSGVKSDKLTHSTLSETSVLSMDIDDAPAVNSPKLGETEEDLQQVSFVGDEELGAPVSEKLATYVNQCSTKRIEKEQLAGMKRRCTRPENCPSLVVPQVNEGIWKELSKWNKSTDVHMQATQNLVAKGMAAVVEAKEALMKPSPSAEAIQAVNKSLSSAIALLGNGMFELSQRRREVLRSGINRRYRSLCDVNVPVTNFLFGDKVQESMKEIDELAKVSKGVASNSSGSRYHPYDKAERHTSSSSKQSFLNKRGQSAPWKDFKSKRSQPYPKPPRNPKSQ